MENIFSKIIYSNIIRAVIVGLVIVFILAVLLNLLSYEPPGFVWFLPAIGLSVLGYRQEQNPENKVLFHNHKWKPYSEGSPFMDCPCGAVGSDTSFMR